MFDQKARDQAYIKQSNIHQVLKTLRDEQPVSRKDIAVLTGMSPTSITRIIGTLLDLSLVVEGAMDDDVAGRGRKAIMLHTNPDGLYTLGFLLNRDYIRLAVHNFDDETLYTSDHPIDDIYRTPEAIVAEAYALYQQIPRGIIKNPGLLKGIGVAISGIVDNIAGIVTKSIQMDWQYVNLRAIFERVFGLPTLIENDVKAALIGEKDRLGIPRLSDTAYLYLGSNGISTAMTSGGELLRGERNAAGEVAHIILTPSDIQCDCGQYGCLQLHVLETYLVRRARSIDPSIHSIDGILAAYIQKFAWAEVLISDFIRHLLLVIALLDSFCNPARIIIAGDIVMMLKDLIAEAVPAEHVILLNDFPSASVRGASILAMQHITVRRLAETPEVIPH